MYASHNDEEPDPVKWREAIEELRAKYDLTGQSGLAFDKEVRRSLVREIPELYRALFLSWLGRDGADRHDVCRRLDKDRAFLVANRHHKGWPPYEAVFSYLATRCIGLETVFPNPEVLMGAVASTLATIAIDYLARKEPDWKLKADKMKHHEWDCLTFALLSPDIWKLLGENPNATAVQVLNAFRMRFPQKLVIVPSQLLVLAGEWFEPWNLLVDAYQDDIVLKQDDEWHVKVERV